MVKKLDSLSAEMQEVRGLTVEVARTNERLAHIIENQESHRRGLDQMQRDIYGPEGLMTKVAVNTTKVLALVSVISTILTVALNFGLRYLVA